MWHKLSMARLCWRGGLAAFLFILAGSAFAAPRLARERCTFKPPRGDRIECFVLIVPENREQPEGQRQERHVAIADRQLVEREDVDGGVHPGSRDSELRG